MGDLIPLEMHEAPEGDEPLWTMEQLAAYLQVPVATIRKWRVTGSGPRGRLVGRYVRFARADIKTWLDDH